MFVAPNVRPESDKWLTEEVAGNCAQPVEENRGQRAGANRNEGLKASSRLCTLGAAFVVDIDTDLPSHAVPEIVRKAKHGRVPRLFLQACDASAFSRIVNDAELLVNYAAPAASHSQLSSCSGTEWSRIGPDPL